MSKTLVVATIVLAWAQLAHASQATLGAASGFNVFTFSNFTPTGADTLGKVAVGGNFSGNNYLVGAALHDSATTLDFIVAGSLTDNNFTGTGGAIWAGSASISNASLGNVYSKGTYTGSGGNSTGTIYAGTYNGPSYIAHAAFSNAGNPYPATPIDFITAQTSLGTATNGLSRLLANTASNGSTTVTANNGVVFTGSNNTQNVFSVTSAQLTAAMSSGTGGIVVNAPAGSVVVINVVGTSVNISGNSMVLNGVSASKVLFNFGQATSITYGNAGITASILAPIATFTGTGGQLNGALIANIVTGNTEFHNDYLFTGSVDVAAVAATPEPATWMMSLTGLGSSASFSSASI